MKKFDVMMSSIIGAVLGLVLHRTLMNYWSLASWLSPVFMFVSAIIGVVVHDPIGCFIVVCKSLRQTVKNLPSWVSFKGTVKTFWYNFVTVQIAATAFVFLIVTWVYTFIGIVYTFEPIPVPVVLMGLALLTFLVWFIVSAATFPHYACGNHEVSRRQIRTFAKRDAVCFLNLSFPVVVFYWIPKGLISINYMGIFEFFITFILKLVANFIIFVGSCKETLVVAFGSAVGYLAGFLSGDFLVCAIVGGLVALVAILVPKVGPVYSWAVMMKESLD